MKLEFALNNCIFSAQLIRDLRDHSAQRWMVIFSRWMGPEWKCDAHKILYKIWVDQQDENYDGLIDWTWFLSLVQAFYAWRASLSALFIPRWSHSARKLQFSRLLRLIKWKCNDSALHLMKFPSAKMRETALNDSSKITLEFALNNYIFFSAINSRFTRPFSAALNGHFFARNGTTVKVA